MVFLWLEVSFCIGLVGATIFFLLCTILFRWFKIFIVLFVGLFLELARILQVFILLQLHMILSALTSILLFIFLHLHLKLITDLNKSGGSLLCPIISYLNSNLPHSINLFFPSACLRHDIDYIAPLCGIFSIDNCADILIVILLSFLSSHACWINLQILDILWWLKYFVQLEPTWTVILGCSGSFGLQLAF